MPLGGLHALPLPDKETLWGPGLCRALAGGVVECISLCVVVLRPAIILSIDGVSGKDMGRGIPPGSANSIRMSCSQAFRRDARVVQ